MTISDAIKKMNDLADIGIVNAKEDAEALRETAKILYRLRERLDPRWNEWLIMDEGQFLEQGDPDSLFGNPQNPRLQDFLRKVL